ncbi:pentatricopeptide repeat-containing protein At5g27110-like [Selaginella moellendorffii]|uniref:pentatricopeptide repeat-containing protein At5g27110-like n=1 Tax=Selaginella moellendorffii TaxID=88036 RepID=UPI000D1C4176|nr:pentatricopeptide repeat-containing protein At5g27110-like [Selaginella moellendorffii]|eukprot:XP_024543298.1 pentatricopeptide repeat-containing protein At5g27110-like [Selaginella moellendorffii]
MSHFSIQQGEIPSCSCHSSGELTNNTKSQRLEGRTSASSKFCALLAALDGSISSKSLWMAREAHLAAIQSGMDANVYIASKIVHAYARCGGLVDARRALDKIRAPNVVSWTALMLGYVDSKQEIQVFELFHRMLAGGCAPNARTFVALLKACAGLAAREERWSKDGGRNSVVKLRSLEKGMAFHRQARVESFDSDLFVANALVDMYSRCGSIDDAYRVFSRMRCRDVVSWNTIILGFAENRMEESALVAFSRIEEACEPNGRTFSAALKACVGLASREDGELAAGKIVKVRSLEVVMAIHSRAATAGFFSSDGILHNGLVDSYAACGSLDDARRVFETSRRDVVSWNSIILGCVETGEPGMALELFSRMKHEQQVEPDVFTLVAALKACGSCVPSTEVCKLLHAHVARSGFEANTVVANSLVDVYGKCGSLQNAQLVFDSAMETRDPVTWNSLMAGFSRRGDARTVVGLFHRMIDEGLAANAITFVHILSACSHAGDVRLCSKFLEIMSSKFGVSPSSQHYNCLVDGLGRSNEMDLAVATVSKAMVDHSCDGVTPVAWKTVLGACHKWENVALGKMAFENLAVVNDDAAAYALA